MVEYDKIDASDYPFDQENGNAPLSISTLMGLMPIRVPPEEKDGSSPEVARNPRNAYWIFRSTCPAYSPGGFTRAFGGHVYAQAGLAASRTVPKGYGIHNMTGHFLLLGLTNIPFIYHITVVRNGGGFLQRRVDVTQEIDAGSVFTAVVSFKRDEKSIQERRHTARLEERFPEVLKGKKIEDHGVAPGVDSPFWWEIEKSRGPDPFPGLIMHKVDMGPHIEKLETLDRRQLQFYKVITPLVSADEDPGLHAAAHLYASDRNGLFPVPNFLEMGDSYSNMASLSHSVVFHGPASEYSLLDSDGKPKWFCIEGVYEHISHGRALMVPKIWDVSTGRPIASAFQDGLVRFKEGVKQATSGDNSLFSKFPGGMKNEKL